MNKYPPSAPPLCSKQLIYGYLNAVSLDFGTLVNSFNAKLCKIQLYSKSSFALLSLTSLLLP